MRYSDAIKKLEKLGKAANKNKLKTVEIEIKKVKKAYTATLKKIQNSILTYDKLPGKKLTTTFNEIDKEIEKLTKKLQRLLKGDVNNMAKTGIMDAKKESMVLGNSLKYGSKIGMTADSFNRIWYSATNKLLTGIDGIKLSDRIWDTNRVALADIKRKLALGIAEGKYPSELANEIRGFLILPDVDMRKTYWKNWFKENPPGKGVYRSAAKNLERLQRTEMGRAYRMGTEEYGASRTWVEGLRWNRSSGTYECPECEGYALFDSGLGEGVYHPGELPVSHPNCLCYLTVEPKKEYIK